MQSYPVISIQFIIFPNFSSFKKKKNTCERGAADSGERLRQLHGAETNSVSCFKSEEKQLLYHFAL